jgi:hypothetical protein
MPDVYLNAQSVWSSRWSFKKPSVRRLEPQIQGTVEMSVIDYFNYFVPDSMFDTMAFNTNIRSAEQTSRSINVTDEEIKQFFGVAVLMGILNYPNICLYWSKHFGISSIRKTMPRNR